MTSYDKTRSLSALGGMPSEDQAHDHAHDHDHSHAHSHEHEHDHALGREAAACCAAPAMAPAAALAASTPTRLVVHIADMDCPAEENMIRSGLKRVPQVQSLGFDLMQRVLTVDHADGARDAVLQALRGLGFQPRMADEAPVAAAPARGYARGVLPCGVEAGKRVF